MQLFSLKTFNLPAYSNLKLDSRNIAKGDVFIALVGHQLDGRNYIRDAIANGAVLVLAHTDAAKQYTSYINNVPVVHIPELSKQISAITAEFYQQPSTKTTVVGITGTNGKTTVSNLIAQWLYLLGKVTAVMGTTGNGLYPELLSAENTTGSAVEVQTNLAKYVAQKAELITMEVSSHSLVQWRVEDVKFAAAVFTNLTRDHLDYHVTMDNYIAAKHRLFAELNVQQRIINIDDPIGAKWANEFKDAVLVSSNPNLTLATSHKHWLQATKIEYLAHGLLISFNSSWGVGEFKVQLIGAFNVSNILLSLATLLSLGYNLTSLLQVVDKLKGVTGRMEIFHQAMKPTIIIDYAHTPDALENALKAVKQHNKANIWCVFGCGGDRDTGKRAEMGAIAEQYAQHIIITDDNPRTEDATKIREQILTGIKQKNTVELIADRAIAIQTAVLKANIDDIVLVAGKGHEDYQVIGTEKIHLSDREQAEKLLETYDQIKYN